MLLYAVTWILHKLQTHDMETEELLALCTMAVTVVGVSANNGHTVMILVR